MVAAVAEKVVSSRRASLSGESAASGQKLPSRGTCLSEQTLFPRIPASAPPVRPARPRVAFVGADDPRKAPRKDVALKCWLMDDEGAARGYALDVSKDGARLSGVGARFAPEQRLLCKLLLDDKEAALVVRCKVVRAASGEVGVRFLELGFDEWFRLGRFLDRL